MVDPRIQGFSQRRLQDQRLDAFQLRNSTIRSRPPFLFQHLARLSQRRKGRQEGHTLTKGYLPQRRSGAGGENDKNKFGFNHEGHDTIEGKTARNVRE